MAQPADPEVLGALTELGRRVTRKVTEQLVAAWNEGVAEGRSPSSFAGPVLVATGDADVFATTAMSIEIAARFRNFSRVPVKGAGHWPPVERPDLIAGMIGDFINTVSAKVNSST